MKKLKYIFISFVLLSMGSCLETLNQAPDGKISLKEVFTDHDKVGAFLNSCYNYIPPKNLNYFFFEAILVAASDDAWTSADGEGQMIQQLYDGSASASYHPLRDGDHHGAGLGIYWSRYWGQIHLCNQFLEHIDGATVRTEAERARWKAEARVMRAFFYSELVKWFGKVPIARTVYDYAGDFSGVKREAVYDVAKFIEEDCDFGINSTELPWRITVESEAPRATKALAYALKSKMLLFAASPLHNGGNNYWEEAYVSNKKAVEALKANGYQLYKTCSNSAVYGTGPAAAYHELITTAMAYSSSPADKETIWQHRGGGMFSWHVNYLGLDGMHKVGTCPSQELVDAYETTDGQPVLNLAKPYLDEKHTQPNYNSENRTYDENNPYLNRDPRFYECVVYNGATVIIDGKPYVVDIYTGGAREIKTDPKAEKFTRTGYYNKKTVVPGSGGNNQPNNAPWKHFRLAEILLNYAEAATEANHLNDAKDAVDEVRARVGMPALPSGLTQEQMRLRVRNERRVELSWEEERYYDLRRWQKPDGDLSETCKWITAMEITKNKDTGKFTYTRRTVRATPREGYKNKDLLLPLPLSEASNMESITGTKWQNPGW